MSIFVKKHEDEEAGVGPKDEDSQEVDEEAEEETEEKRAQRKKRQR